MGQIIQVAVFSPEDKCFVTNDGFVWCVGGHLGNGTNDSSSKPVPPHLMGRYNQVQMDSWGACALRNDDKTVWCWGSNREGQIGDGTKDDTLRLTPVQGALALSGTVTSLTRGMYSTSVCALTENGSLWCWGSGVLGNGVDWSWSAVPVKVNTPGVFVRLSSHGGSSQGGNTDCAIKDDHTVWCWGANNGAVGDGTKMAAKPVQVAGSAGKVAFVDVSVGEERACALTDKGVLWCWGSEITVDGQDAKSLPGSFSQVALGFAGTICAVKTDGTLWCWKNDAVANATQVPLACP